MCHIYSPSDVTDWDEGIVLIYDGLAPIEERYVSSGEISRRYYYEAGLNKLALVEDYAGEATVQDRYIPITDDRGTLMGVMDADTGTLLEKLYYNATGLCKSYDAQTGLPNEVAGYNIARSDYIPFGWCGMYHDEFTGKYHTHFRDFDPLHNRWLSEDPAGYMDGLNLYAAYMGVNGVDLLGLSLMGHHVVPRSLWEGASDVVKKVWDSENARIFNQFYNFHNYGTYGNITHAKYSDLVRNKLDDFMKTNNIKKISDLTADQADEFLNIIKGSKGKLSDFNLAVRAQAQAAATRAKSFIEKGIKSGRISKTKGVISLLDDAGRASKGKKANLTIRQKVKVGSRTKRLLKSAGGYAKSGFKTAVKTTGKVVVIMLILSDDPLDMISGGACYAPTIGKWKSYEFNEELQDEIINVEIEPAILRDVKPKRLRDKMKGCIMVDGRFGIDVEYSGQSFVVPMRAGDAIMLGRSRFDEQIIEDDVREIRQYNVYAVDPVEEIEE